MRNLNRLWRFLEADPIRPNYSLPTAHTKDSNLRIIHFFQIPRGCFVEAGQLFENYHIKTVIRDERFAGRQINTMMGYPARVPLLEKPL